jgi:hypothetical protein
MRRTRNPVYSYAVPWVRIPPFPPEFKKAPQKKFCGAFCLVAWFDRLFGWNGRSIHKPYSNPRQE